jgi:hypothetical protein
MAASRNKRVAVYFVCWVLLAIVCLVLNILNVKWDDGEEVCYFVNGSIPHHNSSISHINSTAGLNNSTSDISNVNSTVNSSYSTVSGVVNINATTQSPLVSTIDNGNMANTNQSTILSGFNVTGDGEIPLERVCEKVYKTHIAQGIVVVLLLAILQGL